MSERSYYVLSLAHALKGEDVLSFRSEMGCVNALGRAGRYSETVIAASPSYNDGTTSLAIPCDAVDVLAAPGGKGRARTKNSDRVVRRSALPKLKAAAARAAIERVKRADVTPAAELVIEAWTEMRDHFRKIAKFRLEDGDASVEMVDKAAYGLAGILLYLASTPSRHQYLAPAGALAALAGAARLVLAGDVEPAGKTCALARDVFRAWVEATPPAKVAP